MAHRAFELKLTTLGSGTVKFIKVVEERDLVELFQEVNADGWLREGRLLTQAFFVGDESIYMGYIIYKEENNCSINAGQT